MTISWSFRSFDTTFYTFFFICSLYEKIIGFSIALLLFMCLFNIQTAVSKMVKYQMVGNLALIHAEGPDASLVCPGPVGSGDLD